MDGDGLTESEPSDAKPPSYDSLAELFNAICPEYMAMGMSYDEFWHKNTICHKAYRKAHMIRLKNAEWERWRQGMYFYDALIKVSPILRAFAKGNVKPEEYPQEPYPITQQEADEREEAREKERYERYIAQMELRSERELKRRKEMEEARKDG